MPKEFEIAPRLIYMGFTTFLLLGVFASIFYLERTTMFDAAYQVFTIIYNKDLAIQINRFGAAATQVFPLLAVQVGFPLSMVLWTYSLAFIIYPCILYIILIRLNINQSLALTLPLFYVFMVSHTFYWMQSELLQACAMVIFFFAFAWNNSFLSTRSLLLFFPGIVTIIFFHPLAFIPFLFLWLYGLLSGFTKNKIYWILLGFALIVLFLKHFYLSPNSYDQQAIDSSLEVFNHWWKFFSFRSSKRFFSWCLSDYYFLPIVLFLLIKFYFRKGFYYKLGLVSIFFMAYLFLVNSTFRWGPAQFHMESFYQILGLFVLIPFVLEVLPSWKSEVQFYSLAVLLLIRLTHIGFQHIPYSQKLAWNQGFLELKQQSRHQKFFTTEMEAPIDTLMMTWASPYETLLLSAVKGPEYSKTLMIANPDLVPVESLLENTNALLTPFGAIPFADLPNQYFNFRDTSKYLILNRDDLLK